MINSQKNQDKIPRIASKRSIMFSQQINVSWCQERFGPKHFLRGEDQELFKEVIWPWQQCAPHVAAMAFEGSQGHAKALVIHPRGTQPRPQHALCGHAIKALAYMLPRQWQPNMGMRHTCLNSFLIDTQCKDTIL